MCQTLVEMINAAVDLNAEAMEGNLSALAIVTTDLAGETATQVIGNVDQNFIAGLSVALSDATDQYKQNTRIEGEFAKIGGQ